MENNQDHVWVSREEYDRLRQAQVQPQAAVIYSNNTIAMADGNKPASPVTVLQVIAGAVLALLSFVYPPAIAVFAIFAAISVFDYYRMRNARAQNRPKKSLTAVYLLLVIVPLALFVVPILAVIAFFVLMIGICGLQGDNCRGS